MRWHTELAFNLAEELVLKLEASPAISHLRRRGEGLNSAVVARLPVEAQPLYSARRHITPRLQQSQARLFRHVIDSLFNRRYYVRTPTDELIKMGPSAVYREPLAPLADEALELGAAALRSVSEPVDSWRRPLAVAYLIRPDLVDACVVLPFWLARVEPGQSDLEAQACTLVGAIDLVEDAARAAKRRLQSDGGIHRSARKPGPKPGVSRRPSTERQRLEEYVARRRAAGVSPQVIAEDGEAQRLYRATRQDLAAHLNPRIIRALLRKHASF